MPYTMDLDWFHNRDIPTCLFCATYLTPERRRLFNRLPVTWAQGYFAFLHLSHARQAKSFNEMFGGIV